MGSAERVTYFAQLCWRKS